MAGFGVEDASHVENPCGAELALLAWQGEQLGPSGGERDVIWVGLQPRRTCVIEGEFAEGVLKLGRELEVRRPAWFPLGLEGGAVADFRCRALCVRQECFQVGFVQARAEVIGFRHDAPQPG